MKYIEITKCIWNDGGHSWCAKIKNMQVKYFKNNRLAEKLIKAIENDQGAVKHNKDFYEAHKTFFRAHGKPVYIVTKNGSNEPCSLLAFQLGKWATDNCTSVDEDLELFAKYGFKVRDIRI